MLEDPELAAFQALLLDRLDRLARRDERATPLAAGDIEKLKAELLDHPATAPFRDYVASCEPRCLEVAISIVRKWAVRTPAM